MTEEMKIFYERLSFCFETRKYADLRILLLDMEPVDIAHYLENNLASRRVMERVGMTFEGVRRGAMIVKGKHENVGVCAILQDEYENQ